MQMVPTGPPGAPPGSFQSTSVTSQLFQHAQAAAQQQQEQQALAAFGQFVAAGGVGGSAFGGVAMYVCMRLFMLFMQLARSTLDNP